MSFYHNPRVITNGLRFFVDFTNPKCFVSGSSTCKDLVQGITGSLTAPYSNSGSYLAFGNGTTGATSVVQFEHVPEFVWGEDDFSYSFWLRTGTDADYNYGYVFGQGSLGNNVGWGCYTMNENTLDFQTRNLGNLDLQSTDGDIFDDVWRHFTFVRSSGTSSLYVNTNIQSEIVSGSRNIDSETHFLTIAKRDQAGSLSFAGTFDGNLFMVWNRALQQSEIEQVYVSQKGRFKS